MRRLIVSNRDSQVAWLMKHRAFRGFQHVRWLGDLVEQLGTGDIVAGSLPLEVAARICKRGATYWNIRTALNQTTRGELSDADRDVLTSVVAYRVEKGDRLI